MALAQDGGSRNLRRRPRAERAPTLTRGLGSADPSLGPSPSRKRGPSRLPDPPDLPPNGPTTPPDLAVSPPPFPFGHFPTPVPVLSYRTATSQPYPQPLLPVLAAGLVVRVLNRRISGTGRAYVSTEHRTAGTGVELPARRNRGTGLKSTARCWVSTGHLIVGA